MNSKKDKKRLLEELKQDGPGARNGLVESYIESTIPRQIRLIRKSRNWSQERLADECGKFQSQISAWENAEIGGWTVQTLIELAEAFDVALIIRFSTFDEFLEGYDRISRTDLTIPSFDEEYRHLSDQRARASHILKPSATGQEFSWSTPQYPFSRWSNGKRADVTSELPSSGIGNLPTSGMRQDFIIGETVSTSASASK